MTDLRSHKNQDSPIQPLPREVSWSGQTPNTIWAGISELVEEGPGCRIVIVIRNSTYLLECLSHELEERASGDPIELGRKIISQFQNYSAKYNEKFIGAGLPESLVLKCPGLCSQLWFKLDIVPLVLRHEARARTAHDRGEVATFRGWERKALDEQADSMARKCIRSFGIGHVIHTQISHDTLVEVDSHFRAHLADKQDYERTVEPRSWAIAQQYARELREKQVKVAFFSMTLHGKPDEHMRHALVRFAHCMGVDFRWYVAKPRPGIVNIAQKMRDILEGLGNSVKCLSFDEELEILEWVYENARRYWLQHNGPLQPRSNGGVDVVIIDSAPLLSLALLSKQQDPGRPVLYENRLMVQNNMAEDPNSPSARVWDFVQARSEHVDLLVSPVPKVLAPQIFPRKRVGYIPVSVDQLDGFNKHMNQPDIAFYGQLFNSLCKTLNAPIIQYPEEQYILHLAQFRPNDETVIILQAYQMFCCQWMKESPRASMPKLLICRHGPPKGRESALLYEDVMRHINTEMNDISHLICVIELGGPDQLWNVLLSHAKVVIQLSIPEGIPEFLLCATQKQKPLITIKVASSYSFLEHNPTTWLVDKDDCNSISHLFRQLNNPKLSPQMTFPSRNSLPDQYTTVGNAITWFYIASKLSKSEGIEPDGRDLYQLAQSAASV
ncbi:heat shock trehalose synthase [Aspergillus udagawae]|nr:heat shock trehalose synthase [Aspergillus udagawae]